MTDALREAEAWFESTQFSRRLFGVSASALAGYAALTQPVAASALLTPDQGLVAGRVGLAAADRTIPAYRARPTDSGDWPVIVVISEVFGLHTYIEDVVRRLARAGYYAIAADYFIRAGNPATVTDIPTLLSTIIEPTPDAQVLSDTQSALAFAASEGASSQRIGVTGFCWGGRQTWLHMAAMPAFRAGVAWYGRLQGTPTTNQPQNPVDVAKDLTRPVLGLYGAKDSGIALETVEAMRAALAAAKSPARILVYADAPHGFHADYRPSYRPVAAEAAWTAALAHFARYV